MIIDITLSTKRILDECQMQTSLDLQAMRARGVETADAVYDDWVIVEENEEQMYFFLQELGADLYHYLHTLLTSYSAGRDVILISIDSAHSVVAEVLESMLRQYFKYGFLALWYANRDANLAEVNKVKSVEAASKVFDYCIPRMGTQIGRYF